MTITMKGMTRIPPVDIKLIPITIDIVMNLLRRSRCCDSHQGSGSASKRSNAEYALPLFLWSFI